MLGLWGTYVPLGAALGLLIRPLCIAALGWRAWLALGALRPDGGGAVARRVKRPARPPAQARA